MVLYGNSFAAPYLNSGLYFQFAEVHSVRSNDIPVEAALRKLPPDLSPENSSKNG